MRTVIEIKNISKSFGSVTVVDQLNLRIKTGEIFALLGLNGAGKTTTIKMMLGLTKPSSGRIKYFNKPFDLHRTELLPRIGNVIEHPGFYEHLTVFENLKIISNIVGIHKPHYIEELLDTVSLSHLSQEKVVKLSVPNQQKLAIARALLNNPAILILDEPFNGLDIKSINEMRALLLRLAKEKNTTIFISSHVLSEIEIIADRIAVLYQGKIIKTFSKGYLKAHHMTRTVIRSNKNHYLGELLKKKGIVDIIVSDDQVILESKEMLLSELINLVDITGIDIYEMYPKELSLEDYFVELVSHERT